MALTKLDYLRIAERVEAMYMNCSTQLILNIVRHLASGKGLSTAEWQLKKLSEMQSLTRESMEIIAANTGKRREAVEQAFREVFGIGLADTEKVLQAAVKAGKLMPVPSVEDSEAMRQLLQAYVGQADDALNLVNTVMLDSTLSRYRYYVNQIDTESQKKAAEILAKLGATDEKSLANNLAYTQNVLNTQSTGVVTGAVARQKAVRDAIKDLAAKGITGFVDAGGHHWTPEAYVNMDIRTTAHNVAIEAQKQRSAEYGVSTFQISTHAGARPLCAPYQGWICSWDNGGGTVTDLYGKEYQVHGINETSYGEAAGIFGINCGHFPETFVDGFSIPRYEELTPEQEKQNEIEYDQSQQQRELEREIRQAKTEAAAYNAAGDKAEFQKAAAKVKEKQTDYKQFCEQTGRTPRPDRTQVSTYSRSEASKVSWSNRKNPTEPKPPRDFTPKNLGYSVKGLRDPFDTRPRQSMFDTYEEYEKAKAEYKERVDEYKRKLDEAVEKATSVKRFNSKSEVTEWAKSQGITIDDVALENLDIRVFNESSYALDDLFKRFPDVKSYWIEDSDGTLFKTPMFKIGVTDDSSALLSANGGINFSKDFGNYYEIMMKRSLAQQTDGFNVVGDGTFSTLIRHEYGHNVQTYIEMTMSHKYHYMVQDWHKNFSTFDEFMSAQNAYRNERDKYLTELRNLANLKGSSEYSNTNIGELFAEGFAEYASGGKTEFGNAFGEFLKRWYK